MQRLYKALKPLSKENRNKIMNDYELQFSQEMKNGKTEQDIIYDLGSPEDAAEYFINIYQSDRGYHDHYNIEQASNKNSSTAHSWEAAIWGTLSIIIIPESTMTLMSIKSSRLFILKIIVYLLQKSSFHQQKSVNRFPLQAQRPLAQVI